MICLVYWMVVSTVFNILKEPHEKTESWRGKGNVIKHKKTFKRRNWDFFFISDLYNTGIGRHCNCPSLFSMVNTRLTTALSFNTIDPFNSAGGQSLFVSYKVSGIPAAPLCGSLLGSRNILCLDECSLVRELGDSSAGKEWA